MTQPGLFDGLEDVGRREPVKRERSWAFGACPYCSGERVGLVRSPDGKHFVWRMHNLTTHAGTVLPCRAVAQRVCVCPARFIVGFQPPRCPHERTLS